MGLHQPAQRINFLELQLNIIIVSYYQSVCVVSKQYNACDNLIGFGMCCWYLFIHDHAIWWKIILKSDGLDLRGGQ